MKYNFNPATVEAGAATTLTPADMGEEVRPIIPQSYVELLSNVTMATYVGVPKQFMAKYDRYEPVIKDHTAYITAKECLRKYFFQIVLGRASKVEAIYFAWGSSYHLYREVLERTYGIGDAAPRIFDADRGMDAHVAGMNAARNYWLKHGKDQPPGTDFEFMTLERMVRSLTVAYQHWTREKMQGRIKVLAVEQSFNVPLPDGIHIGGRADQIIRWNGRPWGRDFKTSSKDSAFFARSLNPNNQFTLYTYAESKLSGEQVQGQFVEVMYNGKSTGGTKKPVKMKGPEVFEHQTSRSATEINQWTKEIHQLNNILESCRENDVYPASEVSCPFCPFHSVCTKPTEGAMMAQLEAHFVVRPWDCTKIGVIDR
jgi:hypothetical protein